MEAISKVVRKRVEQRTEAEAAHTLRSVFGRYCCFATGKVEPPLWYSTSIGLAAYASSASPLVITTDAMHAIRRWQHRWFYWDHPVQPFQCIRAGGHARRYTRCSDGPPHPTMECRKGCGVSKLSSSNSCHNNNIRVNSHVHAALTARPAVYVAKGGRKLHTFHSYTSSRQCRKHLSIKSILTNSWRGLWVA